MNLREISEQEDHREVLARTLSGGWSSQQGRSFEVSFERGDQRWIVQPRLSAYCTKSVTREGRRFIAGRFRFTPVTLRIPLQWTLGTLLGSKPGLQLAPRAFWVTPDLPGSEHMVVIPGFRRIRTFDFSSQRTRSFLKAGFDKRAILNELRTRSAGTGPFIPITDSDPDGAWFEESIVPGYPLPRCPPSWDRRALERRAFELLLEWLDASAVETTDGYPHEVHDRLEHSLQKLRLRYPGHDRLVLPDWPEALLQTAATSSTLELAQTHGDFQPGNVHVARAGRRVFLHDWESTGPRERHYDLFTYGLETRYPRGLAGRLMRYVKEGECRLKQAPLPAVPTRERRREAVALFLLEDLERAASEATGSPYKAPPYGFRLLCAELATFGPRLEALLRT